MNKVIVIPRKGLMIGASLEMLVCGLLACYTALLGVAEGNSLATLYYWSISGWDFQLYTLLIRIVQVFTGLS